MPDLDYGYEVTISQNATFDPTGIANNQWQRQVSGNSNWQNISGATSPTYVIDGPDRGAQIRLVQSLNGRDAISNELSVTTVPQACPYTPSQTPSLSPTNLRNNEVITLSRQLTVIELSVSDRTTNWYGSPQTQAPYTWTLIQSSGTTLTVTDSLAQSYKRVKVVQDYTNSPAPCNFRTDSNVVTVSYVAPTSFGSTAFNGPTSGDTGETLSYDFTYTGSVSSYTPTITYPSSNASISNQSSIKGKHSFDLIYSSPSNSSVSVSLKSKDLYTTGTDPVSRSKSVNVIQGVPRWVAKYKMPDGFKITADSGVDSDGTTLAITAGLLLQESAAWLNKVYWTRDGVNWNSSRRLEPDSGLGGLRYAHGTWMVMPWQPDGFGGGNIATWKLTGDIASNNWVRADQWKMIPPFNNDSRSVFPLAAHGHWVRLAIKDARFTNNYPYSWYTTDNGATWRQYVYTYNMWPWGQLGWYTDDKQQIITNTSTGSCYSLDGGQSWIPQTNSTEQFDRGSRYYWKAANNWVSTSRNGIYKPHNRNLQDWRKISSQKESGESGQNDQLIAANDDILVTNRYYTRDKNLNSVFEELGSGPNPRQIIYFKGKFRGFDKLGNYCELEGI